MQKQSDQLDRPEDDWRELFRCDDRDRAVSVATTIAAMGFDVECEGGGGSGTPRPVCASGCGCAAEPLDLGDPPYVVRVPAANVAELALIVEEIVAEQAEFDHMLAERDSQGRHPRRRFLLVVLIAVVLVLGLLGLLRM